MKLPAMAGTLPFAHLLGRPARAVSAPAAASAEEDEDRKQKPDESDDDYARRMEELDEEKGDGDDEGDGPDDGKENGKKGKKAKGKSSRADDGVGDDGQSDDDDEEGDDDSDGADMRRKGARSARMRERARCAAIFNDKAAGDNPALAATLAFTTDMPRSQAVNVLRAGGVPKATRRTSLDERMSRVTTFVVGTSGGAAPGQPNVAEQIILAGKKRRGEI